MAILHLLRYRHFAVLGIFVDMYCVGFVLLFRTGIVVLGFECPKRALMLIVSIPAKYNRLAAVCRNA